MLLLELHDRVSLARHVSDRRLEGHTPSTTSTSRRSPASFSGGSFTINIRADTFLAEQTGLQIFNL